MDREQEAVSGGSDVTVERESWVGLPLCLDLCQSVRDKSSTQWVSQRAGKGQTQGDRFPITYLGVKQYSKVGVLKKCCCPEIRRLADIQLGQGETE